MKVTRICKCIVFLMLLHCSLATAATNVLVLGDSLSAGYGLQTEETWVHLLKNKVASVGLDVSIINASVSGATSADGLQALPNLLASHHPQIVILALGSNDGLRGYPILQLRSNLGQIIAKARNSGAKVLLIGFRIPPTNGTNYSDAFAESFSKLSDEYDVPLVPFLLAGFETNSNFFLPDRLHPNAAAQELMFKNVWPYFEALVRV